MIHLDLFSGVGGFALAAGALGYRTIGFCEIDPWCRRVLAHHWPEAQFHDDVRTLTGEIVRGWLRRTDVGVASHADRAECEAWRGDGLGEGEPTGTSTCHRVDLLTGGYPCQPFSVAGQRLGAEDDRHLWPEMRRLIAELRPRRVLAENVAGHVTMGLDAVLADLEALGYACGAVVVPACAVDALHRRDRVWILAHADHAGREEQCWPFAVPAQHTALERGGSHVQRESADEADALTGGGQAWPLSASQGDARGWCAGSCVTETLGGVDIGVDGLPAGLVRRPASRPAGWEPDLIRAAWADGSWEADLPRVTDGEIDRRQKLQAAGNAIVPVLACEILRALEVA